MLGYKYTTEQQAIDAVVLCDNYYGYPKLNCITKHWCEYQKTINFWYILYDESLQVILGNPIEIILS